MAAGRNLKWVKNEQEVLKVKITENLTHLKVAKHQKEHK